MADNSVEEARKRMIAKRFGGNAKGAATGGAGTSRRKKKAAPKVSNTDDKKITTSLKKLGLQAIPGIEEVNLFKDNGEVIHFVQPKVQAAIPSKTFVISGNSETKTIQELMPQILTQMGDLNKLSGLAGAAQGEAEEDDDEDMPELVQADGEVEDPAVD
jgi:nascent polypeptide-associated complex subunit beta